MTINIKAGRITPFSECAETNFINLRSTLGWSGGGPLLLSYQTAQWF